MLEPLCKHIVCGIHPVGDTDTANPQIRTLTQGLGKSGSASYIAMVAWQFIVVFSMLISG